MACSPAQLESNRRNALKSIGPKTPEGKAQSRANSLKHGLTGEGIVLPIEDVEEIDRRFDTLEAEMNPKCEMALQLVLRIALMTFRLERSAVNEARMISHRMRQAMAEFDDARLAEVENFYSWIAAEPATNARRLRKTPEGIDRLILAMDGLKADLIHPQGVRSSWQNSDHWHHMTGRRRFDVPVSRDRALSEAISGDFQYLYPSGAPDLEKRDRRLWAVEQQVNLIETEIAALQKLREGLDLEGLELETGPRRWIGRCSTLRPPRSWPGSTKGRTSGGCIAPSKEFREVRAEAPEVEAEPEVASEPTEELDSSFPEAPKAEDDALETPLEGDLPAVEGRGESGESPMSQDREPVTTPDPSYRPQVGTGEADEVRLKLLGGHPDAGVLARLVIFLRSRGRSLL